ARGAGSSGRRAIPARPRPRRTCRFTSCSTRRAIGTVRRSRASPGAPTGRPIAPCGARVASCRAPRELPHRSARRVRAAAPPAAAAPAPDIVAATAVRRAVDAYQLRGTLFANHQMTCADLATGLAAVDAAWLAYTLTSPAAAPGDTGVATPARGLAADVQQV